jgi:hypothetical protein
MDEVADAITIQAETLSAAKEYVRTGAAMYRHTARAPGRLAFGGDCYAASDAKGS